MRKLLPIMILMLFMTSCGKTVETQNEENQNQSSFHDISASEELPNEERSPETSLSEDFHDESTNPHESLSDDLPDISTEDHAVSEDILFRVSNGERRSTQSIDVDEENPEVIFYAEIPIDCSPEIVYLIDADTGETAAELFDEADFEKYGDTIKGDSVYHCRFLVNTDINTNPEISEERAYHYYAEFTENNITHRSSVIEIMVFEDFTDKELDDMEAVENAIEALRISDEYQNASDEQKQEQIIALLNDLAVHGTPERPYSLIIPESIMEGDPVSFEYSCGVGGGVMIKPFSPEMN